MQGGSTSRKKGSAENGTALRPCFVEKGNKKPSKIGSCQGVKTNTKFLPGFSPKLHGCQRRRQLETLRRERARLSDAFLDDLDVLCARHAEERGEGHDRGRDLRIKLVDGTSFQLLDTPENQERFPQSSSQKAGCGFPAMSAVAVFDQASGRMEKVMAGRERKHDARGLYELVGHFQKKDVVMADRAFCSYELIALLQNRETHSVMRLHQKREGKLDWRAGRRLDANSRLVTWNKPQSPAPAAPLKRSGRHYLKPSMLGW